MRRFASSACFSLGTIWAVAGVFKGLFGVRLTLFLLPPLGLERVSVGPSIAIGLALFVAGALLARSAHRAAHALETSDARSIHAPLDLDMSAVRSSMRQPNER